MPKRKSKKIFQYLFLFLIIGTLNNKNLSTLELPKIDEISVSGLSEKENLELLKSLEKFKKNNLFFLSKFELVKIIEKNDYIEKFSVSKKYPSSLNIHLQKTRLMALINKDAKFFFSLNPDTLISSIFGNSRLLKFLLFNVPIIKNKKRY